ncbi:hypothetical protein [Spiroplasma tabanidicola]|uniref:Lipoprotein n=1 Tax=Spiroplasma tabanidicola TaxID=324079 RepID=A0A6I6CCS4_9MOLU|nr:hypothetical protein [Spiroplasma tabanidicola]QGS51942.1 hypothetical protein STABA_v1c05790 [Spiroplasma tabanidicola]
MKKILTLLSSLGLILTSAAPSIISCKALPVNRDFKDVASVEALWDTKIVKTISLTSVSDVSDKGVILKLNKLAKKIKELVEYRLSPGTVEDFKSKKPKFEIRYLDNQLGIGDPELEDNIESSKNITTIVNNLYDKYGENGNFELKMSFILMIDNDATGKETGKVSKYKGLKFFLTSKASFEYDRETKKFTSNSKYKKYKNSQEAITEKSDLKKINKLEENQMEPNKTAFTELTDGILYLDDDQYYNDNVDNIQNSLIKNESYVTGWIYKSLLRKIDESNYNNYIYQFYSQKDINVVNDEEWESYTIKNILNYELNYWKKTSSDSSDKSFESRVLGKNPKDPSSDEANQLNNLASKGEAMFEILDQKIRVKTSVVWEEKAT